MNAFLETKKFIILGILATIALFGLLIASSSKGKWVCKNGVWVARGRVTTQKPITLCK